jgi:hypothetical protein
MRYITTDYVIGEVVDTIGLMQLNNEQVPDLDHLTIESLAEDFIYEWKEVGDYEADLQNTLRQYLTYRFTKF